MAGQQNQAGGPGGQPLNEQTGLKDTNQTGDEIIKNARNEDQLDRFKAVAAQGGENGGIEKNETPEGNNVERAGQINIPVSEEPNDDGLNDADDLHEIRAADDLEEPDPEANYAPTEAAIQPDEADPGP